MQFDQLKRREFISLLGGAAVAWPLTARAQQSAMPVVGVLSAEWPNLFSDRLRAFHDGLRETGYVEGRNLAIEYRWAEGQNDRLPALAAELVRRQVTVIVSTSTPAVLAARTATTTIPIVFFVAMDPVQLGLVTSLSRPGGNLTGVVTLNVEVAAKRLELLHELVPTATIVALLVNPTSTALAETTTRELETAARTLGLEFHILHASSEREIDTAFATLVQLRAGALVIGADALFNSRSEQLAALTIRHRVPAIYQFREFVSAGGLMAYGSTVLDTYRPLGVYTGRILKGEKPADLPVQQATKVELVINMKTAKALALSIPMPLIGRVDEPLFTQAFGHVGKHIELGHEHQPTFAPSPSALLKAGVDRRRRTSSLP
jgi:putative ABC transport system substrate-binding protein